MSTVRYNMTGPNRYRLIDNMASRAKAMGTINSTTDAVTMSYGISSIVGTGVGATTINYSTPFIDWNLANIVTSINSGRIGASGNTGPSQTGVTFFNPSTGAAVDTICSTTCFGNLS